MPAFLGRATKPEVVRAPIQVDNDGAPRSTPAPQPAAAAVAPPTPPAAAAAVPAGRPAGQSPLSAEDTVMELERRLGLRGPES